MKILGYVSAGLVLILLTLGLMFGMGFIELKYLEIFGIRKENIKRNIYEETKSYSHGKTQDLSNYFLQYQKATLEEEKETIKSVIEMQFADFPINKIRNNQLKQFLINIRGY